MIANEFWVSRTGIVQVYVRVKGRVKREGKSKMYAV